MAGPVQLDLGRLGGSIEDAAQTIVGNAFNSKFGSSDPSPSLPDFGFNTVNRVPTTFSAPLGSTVLSRDVRAVENRLAAGTVAALDEQARPRYLDENREKAAAEQAEKARRLAIIRADKDRDNNFRRLEYESAKYRAAKERHDEAEARRYQAMLENWQRANDARIASILNPYETIGDYVKYVNPLTAPIYAGTHLTKAAYDNWGEIKDTAGRVYDAVDKKVGGHAGELLGSAAVAGAALAGTGAVLATRGKAAQVVVPAGAKAGFFGAAIPVSRYTVEGGKTVLDIPKILTPVEKEMALSKAYWLSRSKSGTELLTDLRKLGVAEKDIPFRPVYNAKQVAQFEEAGGFTFAGQRATEKFAQFTQAEAAQRAKVAEAAAKKSELADKVAAYDAASADLKKVLSGPTAAADKVKRVDAATKSAEAKRLEDTVTDLQTKVAQPVDVANAAAKATQAEQALAAAKAAGKTGDELAALQTTASDARSAAQYAQASQALVPARQAADAATQAYKGTELYTKSEALKSAVQGVSPYLKLKGEAASLTRALQTDYAEEFAAQLAFNEKVAPLLIDWYGPMDWSKVRAFLGSMSKLAPKVTNGAVNVAEWGGLGAIPTGIGRFYGPGTAARNSLTALGTGINLSTDAVLAYNYFYGPNNPSTVQTEVDKGTAVLNRGGGGGGGRGTGTGTGTQYSASSDDGGFIVPQAGGGAASGGPAIVRPTPAPGVQEAKPAAENTEGVASPGGVTPIDTSGSGIDETAGGLLLGM